MINLKPWSTIGKEEEEAALRVLRRGPLSGHLGGVLEGGEEVQALEREWSELNGGGYSVAVNSATSGLLIALKAVSVEPGEQVICSPYSMSAGVACVLWLGAEPEFVDIGDDYCLDAKAVEKALHRFPDAQTILSTNLFGNVADLSSIDDIWIVEDNAQAPFTHEYYGDIAVDSFNVHKPVNSGEGGICTTKDRKLAKKLKLLRNHGELANGPPGLNLRMTEITAAIAREQIKKGPAILDNRRYLAHKLHFGLKDVPPFNVLPYDIKNAYYVFPIRVPTSIRDRMVWELQKKSIPVRAGYGGPLYNLPAFKLYARECPNCERIEKELIIMEMYAYDLNEEIINQIIEAFHEVARDLT